MDLSLMPSILIVGASGTGKTTSLRNMDRKTTAYNDIEEKGLPFSPGFKHHFHPMVIKGRKHDEDINPATVIEQHKAHTKAAIESPEIDCIIHDSFSKWDEMLISHQRIVNRNYDIYSGHNESVKKILNRYKGCGKPHVWIGIDQIVTIETTEETNALGRRLKVFGRELEGSIEKEFTIVLYTETVRQADKTLKYFFRTQSDGMCSAKTPMGMFKTPLIDNDLAAVMERVWEWYEEQEDSKPAKAAKKK